MIPSDAILASLCQAIYSPTALVGDWDHIDVGADDNVFWALKKLDGYDIIVFRGSITAIDWFNDFRALPIPTRIGHVHAGFFSGMDKVWAEVQPMLTQPVIVTGHSLGAARAGVLTAMMIKDGKPPIARVVFGEPKPGLMDLAKLVCIAPGRSYRNGNSVHHDVVTDVPMTFPPIQFVHPTPIVVITAEPTGDIFETMGLFAYHHIELYVAGVTAKGDT